MISGWSAIFIQVPPSLFNYSDPCTLYIRAPESSQRGLEGRTQLIGLRQQGEHLLQGLVAVLEHERADIRVSGESRQLLAYRAHDCVPGLWVVDEFVKDAVEWILYPS